jgi:hypothetical protein
LIGLLIFTLCGRQSFKVVTLQPIDGSAAFAMRMPKVRGRVSGVPRDQVSGTMDAGRRDFLMEFASNWTNDEGGLN